MRSKALSTRQAYSHPADFVGGALRVENVLYFVFGEGAAKELHYIQVGLNVSADAIWTALATVFGAEGKKATGKHGRDDTTQIPNVLGVPE
jgi:hypothetical protein